MARAADAATCRQCNADFVPLVVVGLVSGEVKICGETCETISFPRTVAVSRRHQRAGSTSGLARLIEALITLLLSHEEGEEEGEEQPIVAHTTAVKIELRFWSDMRVSRGSVLDYDGCR
jgi:hypothetical protein